MIGNIRPFPIHGLVKRRQTHRLYICRLVNCMCDFFGAGQYIDFAKILRRERFINNIYFLKV